MGVEPDQIIDAAADLIERTGRARQAFARDEHGLPCHAIAERAVCFSVPGALARVLVDVGGRYEHRDYQRSRWVLEGYITTMGPRFAGATVGAFNDCTESDRLVLGALRAAARSHRMAERSAAGEPERAATGR
jgi:hypothetical protein